MDSVRAVDHILWFLIFSNLLFHTMNILFYFFGSLNKVFIISI